MPDDYFSRTQPAVPAPRKPAGVGRLVVGVAALSFLLGGGVVGWLAYDGTLSLLGQSQRADQDGAAIQVLPRSTAQPTPRSGAPTGAMQVTTPPIPAAATGLDIRMAQIEQRLDTLDQRTRSATGNSVRAESLLIALMARRALERGVPLGTLEDQLRLRFGNSQPNAVRVVIDGARQPVTIEQLDAALTSYDTELTASDGGETGWNKFRRQVSNMFVIRRTDDSITRPEQRLAQARQLLRNGQPESAANLIAAMPDHPAAQDWIAKARRLAAIRQALDQLEATAILEPDGMPGGATQGNQQSAQAPDLAD